MSKLFVVSLLLQHKDHNKTVLKQTMSYSFHDIEETAIGKAFKWAQEEFPEWNVLSHICTEISRDYIEEVYKEQKGGQNDPNNH